MHTSLSDHKVIHSALSFFTLVLCPQNLLILLFTRSTTIAFTLLPYLVYRVHHSSLQPLSYRYTQLTCPTAFTPLPHANPSPGSIH